MSKRFVDPFVSMINESDHPLAIFNLINVYKSLRYKKGS